MIWSIVKLIFAIVYLALMLIVNSLSYALYFGWNNKLFLMSTTIMNDDTGWKFTYKNPIAWAFGLKKMSHVVYQLTRHEEIRPGD